MTLLFKVFGNLVTEWQAILYVIIIATITVANLFAIRQQNLKRFLAYSSVSQAGYIMLGVISGSAIGMTSLVYYILVYMISNLAAFGVIAIIENRTRQDHDRRLQRSVFHESEVKYRHDAGFILFSRDSSVCRFFQ